MHQPLPACQQQSGSPAAGLLPIQHPCSCPLPSCSVWDSACTKSADNKTTTCDFSNVASKALPGSACYARECRGHFDFGALFNGPAPDK